MSSNGALELEDGAVSAQTDLPLRERGEKAFDRVDLRSRGRSELRMKAWMAGQPATHGGGLQTLRRKVVYPSYPQ
jgi:hypothetical protein